MWELRKNGVASDPVAESELEAMLEAGTVEGSLAVRPVGKEAWKPAFRHAPFAAAASRAPHRVGATMVSAKQPPALPPPKDPQRWDQQTQLHMLAQPNPLLHPLGDTEVAPPPLPLPPPAATIATPLPPPPLEERPAARIPVVKGHVVTGPVVTVPSMPVVSIPPQAQARTVAEATLRPAPGFMAVLFDTSFTTFVAPRVAKVFYVLFMIAVAASTLAGLIAGVVSLGAASAVQSDAGRVLGLLQLVATPIVALVVLIIGRMLFESLVVFFRVAEHLAEIDRKTPG